MRRWLVWMASWGIAAAVLLIRSTTRVNSHNDQRPYLRARGQNFVFSFLHAHQLGIIMIGERGTGAMVSQSQDGELVVPSLKVSGCVPVRGSKWRPNSGSSKGGREAVKALTEHVLSGKPAAVAVDGPRGPRGRVHKGIAAISQKTGAAVLNTVAIPSRRTILQRTWDKMQIPLPFGRIDGYFADPIYPRAGEKLEAYRQRIEASLHQLERRAERLAKGEPVPVAMPQQSPSILMMAAGEEKMAPADREIPPVQRAG